MEMPRILLLNICLVLLILLVIDPTECRGGRGGGRFGGRSYRSSRSYRSYRSYRSSRSSRVRYRVARTKYSGYRLSSSTAKQAAIAAGTVYGARMWMRRSTYRTRHTYPEVCYNDMYVGNTSVHYYGRFVCPGYGDDDDYAYCCGDIGEQYCCKFFDTSSSQGAGRIAGIVIGVIFGVIALFVLAYCCFKRRKAFAGTTLSTSYHKHDRTINYTDTTDESANKPLYPMGYSVPPPPTTVAYGVQPFSTDAPPNPPSYGDAMSSSYPTVPYTDSNYKPPMPSDDVNRSDMPNGLNPDPTPGQGYMYGQQVPTNNTYPADAPYPPPEGAVPYPPPGGDAPYPPPEGAAPYPPPGGAATYPSAPSAPGSAPYPPQ